MIKRIALGQIRHFLTTVGGAFVSQGYISGDELNTIIGAAVIIIGALWSALTPEKKIERSPYND